jgi:hypothetical protein
MQNQRSKKGGAVPRNRNNRNKAERALLNQGVTVGHLSQCADTYMRVLSNPFTDVDNACIPDAITLPSQKMRVTCRGTFYSGTNGFGFVGINPWTGITSDGISTTQGIGCTAVYSTVNYNYAYVTLPMTSTTGGIATANSNSIYTRAAMNGAQGALNFRLVGCGLRVRYIGTELNMGGRIIMYRQRTNFPDVNNNLSPAYALNDVFYHSSTMSRSWKQITYLPARTEDLSYHSFNDPSNVGVTDYRIMWALVDGTVTNVAFEFESIYYYEIVGVGSSGIQVTRSHSDPVGFGAIMSALPQTLRDTGSSLYNYMRDGAMSALKTATSGLITTGLRVAGSALGGYLLGPPGSIVGSAVAGRLTQGVSVTDAD